LLIAKKVLIPGGSFVCKVFQGQDFKSFSEQVSATFKARKIYKPRSSRKASKEIFIIGLGFKKNRLGTTEYL
jgi:23S rRNA (uridine2552-2'-O)-methyltransferase